MKHILVATTLLTPAFALAQLSPAPGLPASSLNQPNGPAQLDPTGAANAFPVVPSGATARRTLAARLGDLPSIIDLGADPTGAADSTAAFNAASNSNHDYWVPPGRYIIGGCLRLDMVGLRGPGIYQRTATGDIGLSSGAVLAFQPSTKSCPAQIATTKGGVSLEGLTFYWPEQDGSQAAAATTVSTGGAASGATVIPVANAGSIAVGALVFGSGIASMTRVTAVSSTAITVENKTIAAIAAGAALTTWSPVTYPPLLANAPNGQIVDLTFERNAVVNAFDFLATTPTVQGAGDWRVTDNRIYAVRRVFDFSGASRETTQTIDNMFTFGIFGSKAQGGNGYLARWSVLNGEWLHVDTGNGANGFVDGMTATGNLIHGYRFAKRTMTGVLNLFQGVGNTYDGVPTILSVEGASGYVGSDYGGAHVAGVFDPVSGVQQPQLANVAISLNSSGAVRASMTDMNIGYSNGDAVDIFGSGATVVSLRGGAIENWGLGPQADAYGVNCSNPNADVTISTTFKGTGTGTQDGIALAGCGAANLNANVFDGLKLPVLAYSGGQANISGNTAKGTTGGAGFLQFLGNFSNLRTGGNNWDILGPMHVGWPAAVARVAALQTIAGTAKAQVLFATSAFDDTGSIVNSVFTAPIAGYYQMSARVAQNGSGTQGDLWTMTLDQAGSQVLSTARDYVISGTPSAVEITDLFYLAKGDTVRVNLARTSGSGTWTVPADGARSRFVAQLVQ